MATETTREPSSQTADAAGPSLGQLWQVPAFLTGLLAVAGLCAAIPLADDPDVSNLDRDVAAIRRALEQPHGCAGDVLALAQQALARTDQEEPERAGEVHFLLGSVYQRLAAGHCPAGRRQAVRQKALYHLEQADRLGVPEGDRDKLTFRLGQAWFQAGRNPVRVADYLARSVTLAADDPVEGYRMLAQAYLRLPVPNLDAAFKTNLRLLALPTDDEKVLGPTRLACGEILLRQQKPAEALKMLDGIGTGAPPAVLAQARLWRARCCQRLHFWNKAIPLWQEVLRDRRLAPAERGPMLYSLGLCYHNRERPDDGAAARAWAKAAASGGESGQAAALRLAELRLLATNTDGTLTDPDGALEAYRLALAKVAGPADYRNTLIDLNKVRDLLEWGCHVYLNNRHFERSLQLAEVYRKLALPGVAQDLEGQAAEAWAKDLQSLPPARGAEAVARGKKSQAQFLKAGSAFEGLAALRPEEEQPKLLWHSASCFLRGRHYARAVAVLDRFVQHKVADEWRGEAWFALAEARLVLGQKDGARQAYYKAIEYPGPFAFRARFQLALAEMAQPGRTPTEERAHLDQAEALLKQNLEPKVAALAPDAHEKSLFQLASLLFRRHNYDLASLRLQEAVDQYPANSGLVSARDQLADCFRHLADQEIEALNSPDIQSKPDAQIYHRRQKNFYLEKAADSFQKLADDLDRRLSAGGLSETEQAILRKALFAVADCRFDQGDFKEAMRRSRDLAERFAQRMECLYAYQNVWRCACAIPQLDEARDALKKARDALHTLPDEAFRGPPGTLSRKEWERWIDSRAAQLPAQGQGH